VCHRRLAVYFRWVVVNFRRGAASPSEVLVYQTRVAVSHNRFAGRYTRVAVHHALCVVTQSRLAVRFTGSGAYPPAGITGRSIHDALPASRHTVNRGGGVCRGVQALALSAPVTVTRMRWPAAKRVEVG
jgi:hypothetical protein